MPEHRPDPAGPDEPYRDNPHGRLYDSDDGYYMVEPDGSIWELDLSGYRVDALPPGSVEMRPVSVSPAGPDYRELLREVLEQIDNEPAAEHALGRMESYRKAVGLPYGCAYHRSVGARSCACPPEAKEEWSPRVSEVDDALSVLRDLLAKPFYRLWLPVDIAQRARDLVARAGQADDEAGGEAGAVSFVEQFHNPRLVSHETKAQKPGTRVTP